MANTYTQLYIHYVFAVQNRLYRVSPGWKTELYKYMNGIIEEQHNKPFIINGMPDHVHVLVSMNPNQAPSALMYCLKRSSSLWINKKGFSSGKFSWQEGYGAFSCGKSQVDNLYNYILNQEEHHNEIKFRKEYMNLLIENDIDFQESYIFDDFDE
jgi:REP element-mobilizing transposase RayT